MNSLKIGPVPTNRTARLSIKFSIPLKAALDLYQQDYARTYEAIDFARLIPHMLQALMVSDRAFMQRHGSAVRALLQPPLSPKASKIQRSDCSESTSADDPD
jgi:hypothetical protein